MFAQVSRGIPKVQSIRRTGEPSEGWTPFECCSLRGYVHPQVAFQRKLNVAGQGGYYKFHLVFHLVLFQ